MAQISPLSGDCLMWKTPGLVSGIPRISSNFRLQDNEFYFELSLDSCNEYVIRLCSVNSSALLKGLNITTTVRCMTGSSCLCHTTLVCSAGEKIWFYPADTVFTLGLCLENWMVVFDFQGNRHLPYLPDGLLRLAGTEEELSQNKRGQATLDIPPDLESLSGDLIRLLKSETLQDVQLKCGGRNISAHRSILAARSEVFSAMFQHKMAESNTGTIDITGIEAEVLDALLQYLYSGKIPDLPVDAVSSLYEASDRYAIHSLKSACTDWMVKNLDAENCLYYLVVAETHSDEDFKDRVMNFAAGNLESVKKDAWSNFTKAHAGLAFSVYHKRLSSTLARQK